MLRVTRIGNQRNQRAHILGGPGASHQLFARGSGIGGGADQPDDFVDIGHGNCQADQDMAAIARLGEIKLGAAGDDFLTEPDKGGQQLLQVHLDRAAAVQRQHIVA